MQRDAPLRATLFPGSHTRRGPSRPGRQCGGCLRACGVPEGRQTRTGSRLLLRRGVRLRVPKRRDVHSLDPTDSRVEILTDEPVNTHPLVMALRQENGLRRSFTARRAKTPSPSSPTTSALPATSPGTSRGPAGTARTKSRLRTASPAAQQAIELYRRIHFYLKRGQTILLVQRENTHIHTNLPLIDTQ